MTVSENLTSLMAITATDIDGDTFTYAVAGTDASSVSVDTDGVMTFNTAPDYETKTSYSISYSVSDGTETVSQALDISIKDENDIPPTISNLVTSIEIAENTTDVLTVSATDDQDVDLIYSLSGADASAFSISSSGVVSFNTAPNFEVKTAYVITISVSDGINVTSADLNINITNANDAPVISGLSATYSMVEGNTLISDVLATSDEDADAITLSLSGSDASLFQITSSTTLEFKAVPFYASPADANTDNVYEVTVEAADGNATTSFAVSITISSASLSVSGAIFSSRRYVMDSDLPNTDNHAFTANNTFGGAQAIINPSIVNGFVGTTTTAA
ncbi:MAG: Ig-like domain-containing protein, partial [Rhodobacterales bacterium]